MISQLSLDNTWKESSAEPFIRKTSAHNVIYSDDHPEKSNIVVMHHKQSYESYDSLNITPGNNDLSTLSGGKVSRTSFISSVILILQVTMGIGSLALPRGFSFVGVFWGILLTLFYAVANLITLNMLASVTDKYKVYEFGKLIRKALGEKHENIYNYTLVISNYLVMVAYTNIIYDLLGITIYDFFYSGNSEFIDSSDFMKNSFWNEYSTIVPIKYGLSFIILLPLGLAKHLSGLEISSYLGMGALFYTMIIIIIQSPDYWEHYQNTGCKESDPSTYANWFDIKRSFGKELLFFSVNANLMYSFDLQYAVVPVYKTMQDNSLQSMKKLNLLAIVISTITYLIYCFFGFLTSPNNPPELIIFRVSIYQTDMLMTIAKISLVVCIIGEIALIFACLRISFFQIYKKSERFNNKENIVLLVMVYFLSSTLATFLENVVFYISLIGGLTTVLYCFVYPGLIYIRAFKLPKGSMKRLAIIAMISFITSLGLVCGIIDIVNIVREKIELAQEKQMFHH
mmetsp:Transcript_4096/g.4215  ORF Transcript_4096/g.4215 Transcript_4096/m.4215 type:complete len:512 (+) Transcript_4096:1-1536(+)